MRQIFASGRNVESLTYVILLNNKKFYLETKYYYKFTIKLITTVSCNEIDGFTLLYFHRCITTDIYISRNSR